MNDIEKEIEKEIEINLEIILEKLENLDSYYYKNVTFKIDDLTKQEIRKSKLFILSTIKVREGILKKEKEWSL